MPATFEGSWSFFSFVDDINNVICSRGHFVKKFNLLTYESYPPKTVWQLILNLIIWPWQPMSFKSHDYIWKIQHVLFVPCVVLSKYNSIVKTINANINNLTLTVNVNYSIKSAIFPSFAHVITGPKPCVNIVTRSCYSPVSPMRNTYRAQ
jgi:hypothetical protein